MAFLVAADPLKPFGRRVSWYGGRKETRKKRASSIWWPVGEFDQQKCFWGGPSYHPRNWARAPQTVLGQLAVTGKSVKWGGPFWPGSHFRQERRAACPKNTRSTFSDFFGQFLWVLLKFWGQCYVCWPFISPPGRPSLWSRNIMYSWSQSWSQVSLYLSIYSHH